MDYGIMRVEKRTRSAVYGLQIEANRTALDFHVLEYCGGDRSLLLNAVIHFDESTPHLHVASIPIVKDNDESHLSAKKSWET
ncbi:Plasmid recombination enzyme [Lachnospiraceae bacterium KHCPX20]|nr:Plasmid recombination enzyme [Lachnospiraceae bacterium KHCPX20]